MYMPTYKRYIPTCPTVALGLADQVNVHLTAATPEVTGSGGGAVDG
jgi:hypothetical protein